MRKERGWSGEDEEEERSMKSVAAICLALLRMCADAMALTLRNFNEYAMDMDEALAEIYIHPLPEEPELY